MRKCAAKMNVNFDDLNKNFIRCLECDELFINVHSMLRHFYRKHEKNREKDKKFNESNDLNNDIKIKFFEEKKEDKKKKEIYQEKEQINKLKDPQILIKHKLKKEDEFKFLDIKKQQEMKMQEELKKQEEVKKKEEIKGEEERIKNKKKGNKGK